MGEIGSFGEELRRGEVEFRWIFSWGGEVMGIVGSEVGGSGLKSVRMYWMAREICLPCDEVGVVLYHNQLVTTLPSHEPG